MDSDVPDITFNEKGICNYCEEFLAMMECTVQPDQVKRQEELNSFVDRVKRDGKGKEYDCIIGLSGGVDSAWVLYQAKKFGLRPLAVHMDNGWNSELAQSNIEGLVRTLDVDLYTHVIDWSEYRNLMQAFFDADVVDIELLYDNAMLAVNYKIANKYNIKWILAGTNNSTEGMRMPKKWNWLKFDSANIKGIAAKSDIFTFNSFPCIGVKDYLIARLFNRPVWVSFLDLLDYKKEYALSVLEADVNFKRYEYKHYESIFTRFYQGYLLPKKFGIDKRKVHFSTLIVTNQMSRDHAISLLSDIPYPNAEMLNNDLNYFLKKMKWTSNTLEEYLNRPEIPHDNYGSQKWLWDFVSRAKNFIFHFKVRQF